ncbi:hypothetical protein [Desulfoscipio gibsoniae]|uniref:Uncharacterized protein n=1 Tax=Desulfoscipio gibsoniae DSM 7213 TaxID=767817 RepID=R4KH12_9FIRM|nr:hypothetical protein [Desulfoscipio gibsoniae]AGL01899.1 hypothetical protein Desgi_2491 [Desulfoscipio gibsoniae DSM 7213]
MVKYLKKYLVAFLFLTSFLLGSTVAYASISFIVHNGEVDQGWQGVGRFYTTSGSGHGYDGTSYWNYSSSGSSSNYGYGLWECPVANDTLATYVFVPDYYTTASSVKYTILHEGRATTINISSYNNRVNEFVYMGSFQDTSSSSLIVQMDSRYQLSDGEYIDWDEVKFTA